MMQYDIEPNKKAYCSGKYRRAGKGIPKINATPTLFCTDLQVLPVFGAPPASLKTESTAPLMALQSIDP